ncbi:NADH-ubiquinone oxidoreductase-F iron-sulfur binding region domain-containing protein [Streptomyces sp. V4I2]|uniref:NADH-ubiquinone oxidoreductase-F iron-sulfur binding region domain-containing protein n=1 Tax=Streptomyces sp. V4I2 TaxID=3042280 RepID=UPI00278778D6|nr:NADH:ubiquinone oxidoreductase subunit F (NADH-binding) [Streptomyces sp. V4I2]
METLAHLGLIARYGADWFRSAGTAGQPGSALYTVHVPGREVRVVEAPFGIPLGRLLPLAALPADRCGLAETARVLRYLALQSAGQCGPCRNGLPRIAAAVRTLAEPGPQSTLRDDVARWSGLAEGRGTCHHPDGTARLVRGALTTFAAQLDAHAHGLCTATDATPVLPVPQDRS